MMCMLFLAVNLLNHLNLKQHSETLKRAFNKVLKTSGFTKKDLRGKFKIKELTQLVNLR